MRPETVDWLRVAEDDFNVLQRESRVRKNPTMATCVSMRSNAEKYLKAILVEAKIPFARIHDLETLLNSVVTVQPMLEVFRADLAYLSQYAVTARYPGETADNESARKAVIKCRAFRISARAVMGLPK